MAYIFRGRLCGYVCEECWEPLSRVTVKLYRVRNDGNVTERAVASPKDTFAILSDEQVREKESLLIAEAETDDAGNFTFNLGDEQKYGGEAFDVDVYCGTVPPHLPPRHGQEPVQFSITTIQPLWRERQDASRDEREADRFYAWEYCLPARLWCLIRGRFGAWVICGRVTVCEKGKDTQSPVPNVKVRAFDVDWLQDDDLGSGITDAAGHFHIYYTPHDFRITPFSPLINVEWVGGPDVYFHVETLLGTTLLAEPRSAGRTPQRENRGPCTCVHLCIDVDKVPPTIIETISVFDSIGAINFITQVDSASGGDGKTLADDRAFFSTLRLNGILSKTKNGNPLEYTFEVASYDPVTNVLGGYTQIPMSQVAPTLIGTWEHWTGAFPNPVETKPYILNGVAGPGVLVPQVSPDGWVRVPQENNPFAAMGNFAAGQGSSGGMLPGFINLISPMLRAFGTIDESQVKAGDSANKNGTPLGRDFFFSLRMLVREAIGGVPVAGSEQVAGTCVRLAVMNTTYDHVEKNGSWVPHTVNAELGVASLDIQELAAGGGCAEITNALHVMYTAAHPNLGSFSIRLDGPGGPYAVDAVVGGTPANRFDTFDTAGRLIDPASNHVSISDLPNCAYILKLWASLLLTTGDTVPSDRYDELAFCKNA